MDLQWCESPNERMIFAYSSVWETGVEGSHMMLYPVFLIVTLAWNWKTQQNCYMNSYITGCFSYYCWTNFDGDEYILLRSHPRRNVTQQTNSTAAKECSRFLMQSMLTTFWVKYPILNIPLLKSADVWKSSIRFDKNINLFWVHLDDSSPRDTSRICI